MDQKLKPSIYWLALAPLLFLAGVGGGTAVLLKKILDPPAEATFVAPITRTFKIKNPGSYVLSHNYKAIFNGHQFDNPPNLPESAVISLKNSGGAINMEESWGSGSTSSTDSRKEIGRFEITEPGDYTLSISGLPEPHLITLGKSVIMGIVSTAAVCILLNLIGWFGAPAVIIIVLSQRLKNKRLHQSLNKEVKRYEFPKL